METDEFLATLWWGEPPADDRPNPSNVVGYYLYWKKQADPWVMMTNMKQVNWFFLLKALIVFPTLHHAILIIWLFNRHRQRKSQSCGVLLRCSR
jgi:cytosine/uracil/thiamine/allantoin permease